MPRAGGAPLSLTCYEGMCLQGCWEDRQHLSKDSLLRVSVYSPGTLGILASAFSLLQVALFLRIYP